MMGRNTMRQCLGGPTMACRPDLSIELLLCLVEPSDMHSNRIVLRAWNGTRICLDVFSVFLRVVWMCPDIFWIFLEFDLIFS